MGLTEVEQDRGEEERWIKEIGSFIIKMLHTLLTSSILFHCSLRQRRVALLVFNQCILVEERIFCELAHQQDPLLC